MPACKKGTRARAGNVGERGDAGGERGDPGPRERRREGGADVWRHQLQVGGAEGEAGVCPKASQEPRRTDTRRTGSLYAIGLARSTRCSCRLLLLAAVVWPVSPYEARATRECEETGEGGGGNPPSLGHGEQAWQPTRRARTRGVPAHAGQLPERPGGAVLLPCSSGGIAGALASAPSA